MKVNPHSQSFLPPGVNANDGPEAPQMLASTESATESVKYSSVQKETSGQDTNPLVILVKTEPPQTSSITKTAMNLTHVANANCHQEL